MASHIPTALTALSFLSSVASGLQKAQAAPAPAPPPSVAPPAPQSSSSTGTSSASSYAAQNPGTNNPTSTGSSSTSSSMCIQCHVKPRYTDGTKTHQYCGKTCASKNSSVKTGSGNTNSNNCTFCHNRPKYNDGTRTHDYCSKACAQNAKPQRKQTTSSTTSGQTCGAPGCTNPPHHSSDYCSIAHKTLAENLCLMCLQAPKMANSHFCSQTCVDDAEQKGPTILEVPLGHSTFKSVADQFKASWRHGSTCPAVRRIYKIMMPPGKLANYEAYKAAVEAKGQFVAQGRSAGNENRRWHGTRRLMFIVLYHPELVRYHSMGFGKGIYTSSTSSKSNDYSHNDCKSNLKAILLNKVVVGKGCKMLQDNTTLTAAPAGYDSVLAEKGGSLNYDELVVYNNDSIRPSFLVMYDEP
ncbi:hypothetical protein H1R20_g4584, partial [Candolleomyces eurysporus]